MRNELVFRCPKCFHHKPKLSVNIETDEFNCWVCHFRGKSLEHIFSLIGPDAVSEYRSSKARHEIFSKEQKKKLFGTLPEGFVSLSSKKHSFIRDASVAFLKRRGLSDRDIRLYKIGYAEDGPFKNRIIIPSFDAAGEINFVVGRALYDTDVKYKNGRFEKDIVFNELLVDWNLPVILVEGPFDAIAAGTNAIPIQGTFVNPDSLLFKRLVENRCDVYLALDSDARKYRLRIARQLVKYGIRCFDVPMNGKKDFGEMSKEEITSCLRVAQEFSSEIDIIKARAAIA